MVPYSDGFGCAPELLQRTVAGAIMQNVGGNPGAPSAIGQLAHLAFPFAAGEQGALNAERTARRCSCRSPANAAPPRGAKR